MKKKALIIREIFKGGHNAAVAAAAARKPSMKTNKRPFSKGRLITTKESDVQNNHGMNFILSLNMTLQNVIPGNTL